MVSPHRAMQAVGRAAELNRAIRPVEIGEDQVVRPATANVLVVHDFLRHLRDCGVTEAPEPLGWDPTGGAHGVERLRYLEGESGGQGWFHQHGDEGLASAARLLRRVHDASVTWSPPADAPWGAPEVAVDRGAERVICHGDFGPWNLVWHDRAAVGLIDWDYLHPGPRLDDIAYALQWFVPLRRDEYAREWHHFPEVPDRRHRVEVFFESYGEAPGLKWRTIDLVEVVTARMTAVSDLVQQLAQAGVEPQRGWVADGALERAAAEIEWVRENRHTFEASR